MNQCPHCKSINTVQYLTFKKCLDCKRNFDIYVKELD